MSIAPSLLPAPTLSLGMPESGEVFLFRSSFRGPARRFAFQWRLAAGKVGPGEHIHPHETEHFEVVSGRLQVIFGGQVHDLGPGDSVAVPPGVPHHFGHPGDEEAVVEVWLDGPRMEDQFVPLAHRYGSPDRLALSAVPVVIVHIVDAMMRGANVPDSAVLRGVMRALAGVFRAFGAKPLDAVVGWDRPNT